MPAALTLHIGDITLLAVDAIVNAANETLRGGGGVDGAIHRAAGPRLLEACIALGSCPTGQARITPGFNLLADSVIHTVGPVWRSGRHGEDALLASCYRESIRLAAADRFASIAFPAISTGVYGFPPERAAPIAVAAVRDALAGAPSIETVIFCCYDEAAARPYRPLLAEPHA
jgi:O-acetyl-ADP-ribose deacetylase (regulator of RNase III)